MTKLNPSEWNLTECPPDQQEACCIYEYGRSSPAIRQAVNELSGAEKSLLDLIPDFREVLFSPEFPGTPWLQIIKVRRNALISKIVEDQKVNRNQLVVNKSEEAYMHGFPLSRPTTVRGITYIPIRLFWELYSDTELTEQFRDVLAHYRLQQPKKSSGRHSYNDYLRSLGAFRLIEHHSSQSSLATQETRETAGAKQAVETIRQHYTAKTNSNHNIASSGRKQKLEMDVFTNWMRLRAAAHKKNSYLRKIFRIPSDDALLPGGQPAVAYFEDPALIAGLLGYE